MIGDVLKAKNKLGKLIGKPVLKGLLKYMKDDLSCSKRLVNVESFVNTVARECGGEIKTSMSFWNALVDIIKLLSTRPHTSRNGNFCKYVSNDKTVLEKIGDYVDGASKGFKKLAYPKQAYQNLKKYLTLSKKPKNDPNAEGYKRHENLNDKMGSLREVNRLKILATALGMALIDKIHQQQAHVDKSGELLMPSIDPSALPYLTKDGELMLKAKGLLPRDWKK